MTRIKGTLKMPVSRATAAPFDVWLERGARGQEDRYVIVVEVDLTVETEAEAPCSPCPDLPIDLSRGGTPPGRAF